MLKNRIFLQYFYSRKTQQELLKKILDNPDLLPPEEREKLLQNLIDNIGNLDR